VSSYVAIYDAEDLTSSNKSAFANTSVVVQAGDLIVAAMSWEDDTHTCTMTDNAAGGSNVYTQRAYSFNTSGGGHLTNIVLSCAIAKASETLTVTHTLNSIMNGNYTANYVAVFRPTSGKQFIFSNAKAAGAASQSTGATTGSFALHGNAGAAFALARPYHAGTWTVGSGWTHPTVSASTAYPEYRILTNETTLTGDATFSTGTDWTIAAVAYREVPAGIHLVQAKFSKDETTATRTTTLDWPTTPGNCLIAIIWTNTPYTVNGISTPSDTGTVYTNNADFDKLGYIKNLTGGDTAVSVTYSGSPDYSRHWIAEFGGLDTTAPYDTHTSWGTDGGPYSGADSIDLTITTAAAGELIVGLPWDGSNQSPHNTVGTGTLFACDGDSGAGDNGVMGYKVCGAAGAQHLYFTPGVTNNYGRNIIAAFKAATGGSTTQDLAGAAVGGATAAGALSQSDPLAGAALGSGVAAADLALGVPLAAAAVGGFTAGGTLSVGYYLYPDAILTMSGLTGAVADIDDSHGALDAAWLRLQ
jgi:hypothetical protein